jgi:adenosylmethionine---8-amino-7-oxononanoate aminotransferase
MVLSKALTGGYFGLSATIATSEVYESFLGDDPELAFMHGPTFMGNAVACAVALASISLIETENYLSKVKAIEQVLKEEILGLEGPSLCDARVLGAIGVLEFESSSNLMGFREFAVDRGVWLRPYRNWLYTMPPYVISEDDLRRITGVMKEWVSTQQELNQR